ncbi:kunitz-like toxin PcKuz1 [Rhipicephalus sanguineus]|uniref:kunitz-like toxin PcKuz1 n=1 Tax=Rhipicephalus sanguineus TaxID=34632 RepID=UPI0018958045|nr:kunitz-like toxin PcKuz1 [Rhipicephalus sanguineus]
MGVVCAFIPAVVLLSIIASASEDEPGCGHPTCRYPEGCEDPVKVGPRKALIPRFFYNTTVHECQQYSWGGCSANCNNFENEKDCEKRCRPS